LGLLRYDFIPRAVLPLTYNQLEAYDEAVLYIKALHDSDSRCTRDICSPCRSLLQADKLPVNAVANFQYYAYDEL
ncbi:hypothetical protein PAXRUDRAFT_106966, partial [Paxillus rubicundulus Ve08.2h10]